MLMRSQKTTLWWRLDYSPEFFSDQSFWKAFWTWILFRKIKISGRRSQEDIQGAPLHTTTIRSFLLLNISSLIRLLKIIFRTNYLNFKLINFILLLGAICSDFYASIPTVFQRMWLSKWFHDLDRFTWSNVPVFVFRFLQN